MSISPPAFRRLIREITELKKSPPEGIRIQNNEDDSNILDVVGIIQGPGTPYAGGHFRVKFLFTPEFPASPPKCTFLTKIFHPNVSSSGEICVNTLKKDWKSSYGIGHILVTVKCLLIYPNPESALDEEAGKLLLEDYEAYAGRARLITSVHATPRQRPVEFETPSVETEAVAPSSKPASSASSHITLPIITPSSKSSSAPSSTTVSIPLASSPSSNKDTPSNRDRHVSPSPLATADANIESDKSQSRAGALDKDKKILMPSTSHSMTGPKAVKRAATAGGATNAEKRKKALKRL
jgi:ubiquitin-conjugating enzyme E2 S